MGEGPGRRIPRNQLSHPVERDPGLLVLGEEPAEELGELGDEAQVVYEERKVTERKPRGLDWRGGQEKDSPRSQADRTADPGLARGPWGREKDSPGSPGG